MGVQRGIEWANFVERPKKWLKIANKIWELELSAEHGVKPSNAKLKG
jgi:hypothetical protein